jgi:hypothetical protein
MIGEARVFDSVASKFVEMMTEMHFGSRGHPPTPKERAGYRKLGALFEDYARRCVLRRDLESGRRVLFHDVPAVCREFEFDEKLIISVIDGLMMYFPMDDTMFHREVMSRPATSSDPIKEAATGCALVICACVLASLLVVAELSVV